ncbi:MAG: carbamoyltransferase HypF [Candidatus Heimdallarchaeota archaeon]|nr:carbamoyltransferase HypF [Candidatus Heimdallarchaeota archaeon]
MISRVKIVCRGIVQGIGYRPFVFGKAKDLHLHGFVRNQGDAGVLIIAEGSKHLLLEFIESLKKDKPYLAKYEDFQIIWEEGTNEFNDFNILFSSENKIGGISYLPPDISICDDCLNDMKNNNDRRFQYPFTSCAICGPRLTTITHLPYDRPNTTMVDFPLCPACNKEYNNPRDRRHHAQTTCCNICGPQLSLFSKDNLKIKSKNIYLEIAKLIEEGNIIAIKGIGGTHLACSAINDEPILKLRLRKGKRKSKPFAVISKSISDIKKYANINSIEEELLTSFRKPIVLVNKKNPFPLSELVAPNLFNIGVMLPYSGIHSLLLDNIKDPAIILTSANPSNMPMYIDNSTILSKVNNLADFILLHNRRIYQRADDSVIRLTNDNPVLIRRSRGWVPEPINLPFNLGLEISLGIGTLLTSTGAIALKNRCFPTQYIGDIDTLETLEFLESAINHLGVLLGVNSYDSIGCDLHPRYLTTNLADKYATKYNSKLTKIQHHYAHGVALMVDNNLAIDEEIITIVADGVGYGEDGKIWGGEILKCSYLKYDRIGHLEEQMMPGGDRATIYPIRMLASILSKRLSESNLYELLINCYPNSLPGGENEIHILLAQLKNKINTFQTTSTGRVLASVSALLKTCLERTYEGEPAIVLESLADKGKEGKIKFDIPYPESGIINTSEIIFQAYEKYKEGHKPADIALAVHNELADQFSIIAIDSAKLFDINKIGFSGGVAYNEFITRRIAKIVKESNLEFLQHHLIPCGDGGLSIGQAIIAALRNEI